MSTRRTTHIDVGTHEDKIGFTLHYEDGEAEHFLFSPEVAKSLGRKLLAVVEETEYLERQLPPGDAIGVSDHAQVRIAPPTEA